MEGGGRYWVFQIFGYWFFFFGLVLFGGWYNYSKDVLLELFSLKTLSAYLLQSKRSMYIFLSSDKILG